MLPNRMVINAIQINDLRFIVEMFVIIGQRYNLFTIWQSRAKDYDFFLRIVEIFDNSIIES